MRSVSPHLDDELGVRDEQRVARYVATVGSAMASHCYGRDRALGGRTHQPAKEEGDGDGPVRDGHPTEEDGGHVDDGHLTEEATAGRTDDSRRKAGRRVT